MVDSNLHDIKLMKNLFFVTVLTDKCSYIFVEAIFLSIFC